MAIQLWTPPDGGTQIAFQGHIAFRDMFIPKSGKDEWGADTLDRQLRGPACNFDTFYAALRQGQQYTSNGVTYYLQTFKPIEDKTFPGASLSYKGLPFGIPAPLVSGAEVELAGSLTASIPIVNKDGTVTKQTATANLRYASWKTMYRYIKNTKPTGPANKTIDVNVTPQITFLQITDTNGKVIAGGNAPANLVSALTPAGYSEIATLESYAPIIGSPYFECADSVVRQLPVQ